MCVYLHREYHFNYIFIHILYIMMALQSTSLVGNTHTREHGSAVTIKTLMHLSLIRSYIRMLFISVCVFYACPLHTHTHICGSNYKPKVLFVHNNCVYFAIHQFTIKTHTLTAKTSTNQRVKEERKSIERKRTNRNRKIEKRNNKTLRF